MSVFKTTIKTDPPAAGSRPEYASGMSDPLHPKDNDSVQVTMTPVEQARLLASNYPHYDALSVVNLKNRR